MRMDDLVMLEGFVSGIEFGRITITCSPMFLGGESRVELFVLESDSCFETAVVLMIEEVTA